MVAKKKANTEKKAEDDEDSLNATMIDQIMKGKSEIVSNDNEISNEMTHNLFQSNQDDYDDDDADCLENYACLDNNNSDDEFEIALPFSKRIKLDDSNENKPKHYTADIIVEIKNRNGETVPIKALLDTGTTATIILREFVQKGRARTSTKRRTKWKTLGGNFTTKYESLLDFKFPELNTSKTVTWQAHVDEKTSSKEASYDMIIGMDMMTSIGITVDCEQKCIRWGGTEIPLKTKEILSDKELMHMLYQATWTPDVLQEAESRQNRILDADYSKIEVDPYVQELSHLSEREKEVLAKTLKKFPTLFGGGTWNVKH
jgi:hypothetical protein